MDDIYVYLEPLPDGVTEMIAPCFGGYTIYLDPRQSFESMVNSYKHALSHIQNDDFSKLDVQGIEEKAHIRREKK